MPASVAVKVRSCTGGMDLTPSGYSSPSTPVRRSTTGLRRDPALPAGMVACGVEVLMARKDEVGRWGEELARRWLERQGWRIVDVNWRCPSGEVDIVAARDGALVFFEVKTRTSTRFGHPLEAISAAKLARMRRVAGAWLAANPTHRGRIRLDLLAILTGPGAPEVDHVEAVG